MTDRHGMDAATGQRLTARDHLRQSITDIIRTPKGSRIERRDYGSDVPQLIDQPQNPATLLRLMAASALALQRWEPAFQLARIEFSNPAANGSLTMTVSGYDAAGALSFSVGVI